MNANPSATDALIDRIQDYAGKHFPRFVEELKALCRIPSLSADHDGLWRCARHLEASLVQLRFACSIHHLGGDLDPPLIVARRDTPGAVRTLLVYGHFDVQPVDPVAAWTHAPFEPTQDGDLLYGRGTADDKGQFFAHLKAFEAFDALGIPLPVNVVLVLDSQEEVGSPRLEGFVSSHRDLFAADFAFCADGESLVGNQPVLQHGNRGDCFLTVRLRAAARDAHSGTYGGALPNAANRLVAFLATLVDAEGTVQIPGFYDDVSPPTPADRTAMARLPHDEGAFAAAWGLAAPFGPPALPHWERIMFRPTLNIAGLTAGYQGPGTKTVIPCEASAKIDMRLVKNQTPDRIIELFKTHAIRLGRADIEIEKGMQYRPARTAVDHPFGLLVHDALARGFDCDPVVMPCVGGSNPNFIWMEVLGLPMAEVTYGQHDCRMHAPDEHFALGNLRHGIATTARVLVGCAHL